MSEPGFPKPVAEVVATLADIFRHQRRTEVVEILESAHAWLDNTEYDNWNGGTYTWALRLEVPVPVFASIEPHLPKIEKELAEKLGYFSRLYPNDHLSEATVSPIAPGSSAVGQRIAPPEIEVRRLWPEGRFRLFLSHVSAHKVEVSKLKAQLGLRGVAAFVAHEDIEPSLEWRDEIELGLRSMHALAALITPEFHASPWTDQEIGWALGRGLLVVPVRLGSDPYGFAGKIQGISGTLENPVKLASSLVASLLLNAQTHGEMRRSIVSAFSEATSYEMAQTLRKMIVKIDDFTDEEKAAMQKACTENSNVARAYYVPEAIYKVFGKPPQSSVEENKAPKPISLPVRKALKLPQRQVVGKKGDDVQF
jgi:hypothetical protein